MVKIANGNKQLLPILERDEDLEVPEHYRIQLKISQDDFYLYVDYPLSISF